MSILTKEKVKIMESENILILGLMTGEHLLATVDERQGAYLCTDVMQIIAEPDPENGSMRMGFTQYMPYADQSAGFAIPTNMCVIAMPTEEMRKFYSERFGRIITPPTPKIIL